MVFNRPSMLQHVEQGKRTEIDALNGARVRAGCRRGVPTPYNEALVWLTQAAEPRMRRPVREGPLSYERLEAEVSAEPAAGASTGPA